MAIGTPFQCPEKALSKPHFRTKNEHKKIKNPVPEMRSALLTTTIGVLLVSAVAAAAATATVNNNADVTSPKVIIFALADDYGFNNVGFAHGPSGEGNPEARTPTMDRLAVAEGVRLERHYVYVRWFACDDGKDSRSFRRRVHG